MNHYWCFIDGAPTLIDGWHWFSLNYWDMEGKKPDYRDRDRRKFLFWKYTYTATETYRDIDDKGEAYPDEDGYYRVVDTGKRVFMGNVYPKHRRDGATHNSLTIGYELITRHMNKRMGIQSFDETNAEKHYEEKFVNAWKRCLFSSSPCGEVLTVLRREWTLKIHREGMVMSFVVMLIMLLLHPGIIMMVVPFYICLPMRKERP